MTDNRKTIVASNITAVGTGPIFGPAEGPWAGLTRALHIVASGNFEAIVRGTNFYERTQTESGVTWTGSNWSNVGSPITASGLYRFDTNMFLGAYHLQVNSISSPGRIDAIVV